MPEAAVGHREQRDANPRAVALTVIGFVVFVAISMVVLALVYGVAHQPLAFGAGTGLAGANVPVLQTQPKADRAAYDLEKSAELNGLGWTDQAAGVAHIPIADAMRIIAQRGIPGFGRISPTPGDDPCAVVAANVPRAPQAGACANATGGAGAATPGGS